MSSNRLSSLKNTKSKSEWKKQTLKQTILAANNLNTAAENVTDEVWAQAVALKKEQMEKMNNRGGEEDLVEAPEKNTMSTLGGKPTS